MKSSSSVPTKLGGVLVGLAVLCSSSQHVRGVETTAINASSRLVSVEPMAGEMCALPVDAALQGPFTAPEDIPVNPVTVALGMNVRALQPLAAVQQQGGRGGAAGVHDGAGGAAAGAADGDQRGEAYGGTGAPATPAHLRSLSAVQRRGGRSGERRGRAAGREPVPDPGLQPDGQHAGDGGVFGADARDQGRKHASRAQLRALHRPEDRATSIRSTTTPSGA